MGLFFEVLSAINNPHQQGSVSQLSAITNTIQQLTANQGIEASKTQTLVSALGELLRPALQQHRTALGSAPLETMLTQALNSGTGMAALQSIFTPQLQQQIIQAVAQKTGFSPTMLQPMLPTLIPAVLGLLNMGAHTPNHAGENLVLSTFLDSDRDTEVDLGDVIRFAGRFLNPPAA